MQLINRVNTRIQFNNSLEFSCTCLRCAADNVPCRVRNDSSLSADAVLFVSAEAECACDRSACEMSEIVDNKSLRRDAKLSGRSFMSRRKNSKLNTFHTSLQEMSQALINRTKRTSQLSLWYCCCVQQWTESCTNADSATMISVLLLLN